MRIVIALGGNALLRRGEPLDAETQRRNVRLAAEAIAPLAAEHALVITHGNGPQVGLLALQADAYRAVRPYPLDVLGAESEGMIGYLIERELAAVLPGCEIATLLTQVEVDPADPAFSRPTKPIGPIYDAAAAEQLRRDRDWTLGPDGEGFRRLVPSPEPRRIREINTIRLLAQAGVIVVCSGGGGIPVVTTEAGAIRGVEAVIDKDLSAALLAVSLRADALLLLTDVDGVYEGWRTPAARRLARATPAALRALALAPGSMGPKAEAACRFVEATGRAAGIGALSDAARVLKGETGTLVAAPQT